VFIQIFKELFLKKHVFMVFYTHLDGSDKNKKWRMQRLRGPAAESAGRLLAQIFEQANEINSKRHRRAKNHTLLEKRGRRKKRSEFSATLSVRASPPNS
jgi:hypothetical protein